jgi:signal transduction histidine kinase
MDGRSSLPSEELAPEKNIGKGTLVEAELVTSLAWLIRLRWFAGIGVILGTWLVGGLFNLRAPSAALYAIGAGILFYNLAFYLAEQRLSLRGAAAVTFSWLAIGQALLDWVAMTSLIHFSGGIESPAILFFIFHIIIASIFFTPKAAYGLAALAAGLLAGIVFLEYSGLIPHMPLVGLLDSPLYQNGLYILAVLFFFTSTALISAYLASTINERLRKREAEVMQLTESLHRATVRLQTLNDTARDMSSTLNLPQVLDRLVQSTARAMDVRACSIRLLDAGGRRLEAVAVYGLSQAYLKKGPVDAEENLLARQVLSGRIVNIPDALNSPLLQYPEEARQEGIRSVLSAPLIGKNGPLGILRAYAVEPARFNADDEAFLKAIAAEGSIAIENAMAYRAVEALDASKSHFIRIVTHELRSPVSVIRSLLQTMISGYTGELSGQQLDILQRASRRAEFLQKLIDDLLDLAAGKMETPAGEQHEPVDLGAAVEKVVQRFEVPAREKRLALEFCLQDGSRPIMVMATLDGLDRIFNNLISNAVKYTPPGGRVTVSLLDEAEEARVVVEDSGIGIPEEALGHLFEEFYRAPNARALEREGTGLGLTIARDLLTRLGGRVAVYSQVGQGTRFTVTLPLATVKV